MQKEACKNNYNPKVSSASEYESEIEVYADTSESLASLNQCLSEISETPGYQTLAPANQVPQTEVKKVTTAMKRVLIHKDFVREGSLCNS